LGHLVAPAEVRRRTEEMSLGLVEKSQAASAAPRTQPMTPLAPRERKR
jgi:hypothetical protein